MSFIILTWNSSDHISGCLDSIFRNLNDREYGYEIYIIDNGSRDGTRFSIEKYKSLYPDRVKPIYFEKNKGTTYTRNVAIRQAQGNFLVIMDSDVELHKGTVEKLVEELQLDKEVGLTAPKLIYGNGTFQKSTDDFPTIWSKLSRYFFLKIIEKRIARNPEDNRLRSVDYAVSALWVMRKEVISKVGLLDENIFYAPEDVDYCLRMRKAGYRILYVPTATATHHAQELSRGLRINKAMVSHIQGLFYFFKKHKYIFNRPRVYRKPDGLG